MRHVITTVLVLFAATSSVLAAQRLRDVRRISPPESARWAWQAVEGCLEAFGITWEDAPAFEGVMWFEYAGGEKPEGRLWGGAMPYDDPPMVYLWERRGPHTLFHEIAHMLGGPLLEHGSEAMKWCGRDPRVVGAR